MKTLFAGLLGGALALGGSEILPDNESIVTADRAALHRMFPSAGSLDLDAAGGDSCDPVEY